VSDLSAGAGAVATAFKKCLKGCDLGRRVPLGRLHASCRRLGAKTAPARLLSCVADRQRADHAFRSLAYGPLTAWGVARYHELPNKLACLASVVERISLAGSYDAMRNELRVKANAPVRLHRERKGKSHGHRIGYASVARGED
jgi:hypothetical protein